VSRTHEVGACASRSHRCESRREAFQANDYAKDRALDVMAFSRMIDRPGVLFLDDDEDLRETFSDLVRTVFDRECFGLRNVRELVALGDRALRCGLAILDINLGRDAASGLDAYAWLHRHGFAGRIVFLTGHANSHPLVVEASRIGDAEVVAKPVSFDALSSLIDNQEIAKDAHP
jgi:FixJ family two-component response regulator